MLYKFKETDILQSFETFVERLTRINIRTTTEEDFSTVFSKLTFLYKLGVVGLYYKKEYAEKKGYGYHTCFVFNEGLDPIEELAYDDRVDIAPKIIFNPIFAKKLDLNYNTKEKRLCQGEFCIFFFCFSFHECLFILLLTLGRRGHRLGSPRFQVLTRHLDAVVMSAYILYAVALELRYALGM